MRFHVVGRVSRAAVLAAMGLGAAWSCSSDEKSKPKSDAPEHDAGKPNPVPAAGEACFDPDPTVIRLRSSPAAVVVAVGRTRRVKVTLDPDVCKIGHVTFTTSDESVAGAPAAQRVDLLTPTVDVDVTGVAEGTAVITATFPRGDGTDATADISVRVSAAAVPACSGSASGRVGDGMTLSGTGGLAGASVALQAGATKPNAGSFLWHADPFDATIDCAPDQLPEGFAALGPAIAFGPAPLMHQRDIPFSVPINPAALPDAARLRHVAVSYTGPRASAPRTVGVTNPRIVEDAGGWRLEFLAPWLGTYQAVVREDAGTATRTRKLRHRAVIGVSMGGGGAAMVGMRHHERFDVVAALGGPVDWTWMIGHIQRNHVGGFLPVSGGTPPASTAPLRTPTLPYEHPSSFNQWWYEFPKEGNGGSFDRAEYVQIFRDLALMFGNPNYPATPGNEHLPLGVPVDHPSVVGNRTTKECLAWVDPIAGHPDETRQKQTFDECPAERCDPANRLVLTGYYDDEFNPDGSFPVISVCDGTPQDDTLSPYANTWKEGFERVPLEVGLAVDYDRDGVRDENEPIIRSGHEPYRDHGTDGVASTAEPGYRAGTNEDPAGDDWHPQYNPSGTENNLRYDAGEPFDDFGLDGVDGTASSPFDVGEGNGKFDQALGLQTFLERDTRTVIEQQAWGTAPTPLDDAALSRVDLWTDGGTRDLFNFSVDAQALIGAWGARGRNVHYYNGTHQLPGQDPASPTSFIAGNVAWDDVPGGVFYRYGAIDPTDKEVQKGNGQHVGPADQIVGRLQAALYYIGSRWPDAPKTLDDASSTDPNPDLENCVINGACDFTFEDSRGRSGPVSVSFPPGYGHIGAREKRYPVIYMLHGYGQTPEDLKASLLFLNNWMNSSADSSATRLPKALLVFVDGRCRPGSGTDGESECVRGTFFTDSVRTSGPKMESWWLELMDEIDSRYRTMGAADVEWTE